MATHATPFNKTSWMKWVMNGTSKLKFEPMKKQKRVPPFICSKCFEVFRGVAIRKHKENCK